MIIRPWVIALLLLGQLSASADLMTTFDEGVLPAGLNLDIPNAGLAAVSLDTVNQELDFTTTGNTDLWTVRNNAPIAWTARPSVGLGDTWYTEAHVRYNGAPDAAQRVAGLLFYQDVDGTGGSTDGMDFGYGINDWDNRSIEVQGFGGTQAGDSGVQTINALAAIGHVSEIHMRIEVMENGASDQYTFFYRQAVPDAWTQLAQFNSSQDNSRVGLFFKNGGGTASADRSLSFTYFNVGTAIPEPRSAALLGRGARLLAAIRRGRGPLAARVGPRPPEA